MKRITEITIEDARAVFNEGIIFLKEISVFPSGKGANLFFIIGGHKSNKSLSFDLLTEHQSQKLKELGYEI